jgi:ankyrin repeat protein
VSTFFEALRGNDFPKVSKLLQDDPSLVYATDPSIGDSPLHCTATDSKIEIVKLLIFKGAHIDAFDHPSGGMTPLMHAIYNGAMEIVRLLIAHGANVNATSGGRTALHVAANCRSFDVIGLLLNLGADIHACGSDGVTPLRLVQEKGDFDMAEWLIHKGAKR